MSLEILGIVTILAGFLVLAAPIHWSFYVMTLSTLFGAAAALSLPMLGGASVLVPSLFLPFFAMRIFMATGEGHFLAGLRPLRAGFWLLLLTAFGITTAIFFPRLFQGILETLTVERIANGRSFISLTPLRFSSNNITSRSMHWAVWSHSPRPSPISAARARRVTSPTRSSSLRR